MKDKNKFPYSEVLKKIKPQKEERKKFEAATASFLSKLHKNISPGKAILGGSGAKDTWLSGNPDIDIFVLFPYEKYKLKSEQLSTLLKPLLTKTFPSQKIAVLHGSRDYFQISFQGFTFEIVPILNIKKAEQTVNITDVSPLHAQWVNTKAKNMKDEVRLAKQFCKAQKIYGAESHIQGFSGYVLEILIVFYGSFQKLLAASQKWKEKEVIDVAKHYPKQDALFNLNKSKQQSPLIVIDPVDKKRNAAAALSFNSLQKFCLLAKEFLNKPLASYFELTPLDQKKLQQEARKQNRHLLFLVIKPIQGKEDVVGVKLWKVFTFLQEKLKPYVVTKADWEWNIKADEACFFFFVSLLRRLSWEIRQGPPLNIPTAAENFKRKHPGAFVKKGRLMAKLKVKNPLLKDFMAEALNDAYVQERIKKVRLIKIG
ncbi:CCA tRNA nucleotidyltransferase [Candidatus Woesearchaeota archaeon]|nr:CCA tRNA nucleotidyltransferase [Candidatus Woesearchaeota archaeon]